MNITQNEVQILAIALDELKLTTTSVIGISEAADESRQALEMSGGRTRPFGVVERRICVTLKRSEDASPR